MRTVTRMFIVALLFVASCWLCGGLAWLAFTLAARYMKFEVAMPIGASVAILAALTLLGWVVSLDAEDK